MARPPLLPAKERERFSAISSPQLAIPSSRSPKWFGSVRRPCPGFTGCCFGVLNNGFYANSLLFKHVAYAHEQEHRLLVSGLRNTISASDHHHLRERDRNDTRCSTGVSGLDTVDLGMRMGVKPTRKWCSVDEEFVPDSPLEGDGFELLVPRHESPRFPKHPGTIAAPTV